MVNMETTAAEAGREERLKHSDLQWEYAQTGTPPALISFTQEKSTHCVHFQLKLTCQRSSRGDSVFFFLSYSSVDEVFLKRIELPVDKCVSRAVLRSNVASDGGGERASGWPHLEWAVSGRWRERPHKSAATSRQRTETHTDTREVI